MTRYKIFKGTAGKFITGDKIFKGTAGKFITGDNKVLCPICQAYPLNRYKQQWCVEKRGSQPSLRNPSVILTDCWMGSKWCCSKECADMALLQEL